VTRIAKAHVKPPEAVNGPVTLVDYDPDWDALYLREAARIRAALGDRLLLIEHVGSTAVPGLAAKPKIDIVAVVSDSSNESDYVSALQARGMNCVFESPIGTSIALSTAPIRSSISTSSPKAVKRSNELLRFRDHPRRSETDRMLYQRTKRALARQTWKYTQNYADAKSAVVEEILARSSNPGEPVRCERHASVGDGESRRPCRLEEGVRSGRLGTGNIAYGRPEPARGEPGAAPASVNAGQGGCDSGRSPGGRVVKQP
jgi:GrpB-like predicted nucleotidyltransferase (UPF0157 family)